MPKQSAPLGRAAAAAARVAAEMGYSLIDTELVKEPAGRFLRFTIEKEGGVTLNDCEAFHRRIQPLMDNIDYDYMEVSSPGADRPLKTEADFLRAMDSRVEVRLYRPVDGSKLHTGYLVGYEGGQIEIEDDGGKRRAFDQKKDVALIKPLIEFSEEDLAAEMPLDEDIEGVETDERPN